MADWNPSLYLQFASERTRPAAELLARIAKPTAKHIADLGCGPGNSTELLHDVWPDAVITGVDNSPAMLEKAQQALPDCQFVNANISEWQPEQPLDVLYANASLQWVPIIRYCSPTLPHCWQRTACWRCRCRTTGRNLRTHQCVRSPMNWATHRGRERHYRAYRFIMIY